MKKCLLAMIHSANKQRNYTNLLWLLVLCLLLWPLWFFIILLFSWHRAVFAAESNITTFISFIQSPFLSGEMEALASHRVIWVFLCVCVWKICCALLTCLEFLCKFFDSSHISSYLSIVHLFLTIQPNCFYFILYFKKLLFEILSTFSKDTFRKKTPLWVASSTLWTL